MPLTTWTCACGLVFKSFPPAERHANAAHHGARISVDVPARKRP